MAKELWYISVNLWGHVEADGKDAALRLFDEAAKWTELRERGLTPHKLEATKVTHRLAESPEEIAQIIPEAEYNGDAGYFTFKVKSLKAVISKLKSLHYQAFSTVGGYLAVSRIPKNIIRDSYLTIVEKEAG